MADQSLDAFLNGLCSNLMQTAQTEVKAQPGTVLDEDFTYFTTPAPNAIEWSVLPEFLDIDTVYHHVREYQIIRDYFQLRCPLSSCNNQSREAKDCWDKGKEYLQSENLLTYNKKYGEDVCPCCGSTRAELTDDKLLEQYDQLHVIAGMRSGKTATAGIVGTYIEHRIINIGHANSGGLSKFFHQLPKNPFEISFIASTDVQSADTIWARYIGLRANSPWLTKYVKWIKAKEKAQTTPDGSKPWEYFEAEKYIVHGALNLKINSLNSNSSGMAGRTRIAAFIDELARFENTDSARGADEAYRVLENSLRTLRSTAHKYLEVRPEAPWLGSMISISSPISEDDKAMRLLKQAPNIRGMYYGHYATWEFNPDQPREMFDDDFEKDPIGAMRDFGAQPPTAASPLIQDPMKFRELAIQKDLQPTAMFLKHIHQDKSGREYVSTKVINAQMMRNGERMIAFDAGASFDQFAAACAHGEWVVTPEGRQLVTVYDWVYRLLPETKPRREIWFDFVVNVIEHLVKYYYVGRIEFDRWQSTYLIQMLRNKGIVAEMKGTNADMYNKFINDVNYSKVRMLPPASDDTKVEPPFMSAPGLAFYELERLERSPDLKKVTNPRKGMKRGWDSDDVATVVVHCNYLVQSSIIDLDSSNSATSRLKRETSGGHNWVGDGGGKLIRPRINNRGW